MAAYSQSPPLSSSVAGASVSPPTSPGPSAGVPVQAQNDWTPTGVEQPELCVLSLREFTSLWWLVTLPRRL